MLAKMQTAYDTILENGDTHNDYLRHLFKALLTASCRRFVGRIETPQNGYIQDTSTVTVSHLISYAKNMYTNLVDFGEWGKIDPQETKLLALQTQFAKYKKDHPKNSTCPTAPKGKLPELNPLRKVKKGDSMIIDGKQMWWCPQHVHPRGKFNGLYMEHKPEEHHIWAAEKKRKKEEYKKKKLARKAGSPNNSHNNNKPKSFKINDQLRTALCTQGQLTPERLEEIIENSRDFQRARMWNRQRCSDL
jgi:hypothetical protein